MYSNGYTPPHKPTPRKRRAGNAPVAPARVTDAAAGMQSWQRQAQDPSQRNDWQQGPGVSAWQQGNARQAYPVQGQTPQNAYTQGGNHGEQQLQSWQQGNAWQQNWSSSQPVYDQRQPDAQSYGSAPAYDPRQTTGYGGQQPAGQPGGYDYRQPAGQQGAYDYRRPGGSQPGGKRRALLATLLGIVLVAALAVGGTYGLRYYQTKQYVSPYDNLFVPGVYVDGISLGGMTPDEGVAAVTQQAQQRNDAWSVQLTYQGQLVTEITAAQLGMTVDVIDVMKQAWAQGHTGDLYARKQAMESLAVKPYTAYTAAPSGDTSVIDGILEEIKNQVYRAPQDAALTEFNPANDDPFTFSPEVEGRTLDTGPIKETLYQMVSELKSGEVEIQPDTIAPDVTVEQLRAVVTKRAMVYTPIDKNSTDNRNNNIRRCFQLISGYVVKPGKKFSFNGVVGQRTLKNGFYEAIEYAYGDLVMGVGGGSCQASTTLYQAAVEAGLEILDRSPHSDSVSYAKYGEDATVYWNGSRKIDLVFRNNTDNPLYLVASVENDPGNRKRLIAKVTIYGESMGEGIRYELQSETIETIPAPVDPVYVKDKDAQYVTYTDQQYQARKAKDGYVVKSYRVKYENDQAVERTLLFTDRYEPKAERIYVGVTKRDTGD